MSSSQAADDELPLAERLKSSLWFSIARICTEECSLLSGNQETTTPTPQFIGALTEMVWTQIENVAVDLETFSRHAGRRTVNTDDVLLVCRRNEALQSIMRDFIEKDKAESGKEKKAGTKGKGKAKGPRP